MALMRRMYGLGWRRMYCFWAAANLSVPPRCAISSASATRLACSAGLHSQEPFLDILFIGKPVKALQHRSLNQTSVTAGRPLPSAFAVDVQHPQHLYCNSAGELLHL